MPFVLPTPPSGKPLGLLDCAPGQNDFAQAVIDGLSRARKELPCKFFYDGRGSELFDQICQLTEYYPTRTELRILRRNASDIAKAVGPRATLIEYGSGSSLKTRILLDAFESPRAYVPIDISREHLLHAARALSAAYPAVNILPVCADYTQPFELPAAALECDRPVAFFPGSTIGNFEPRLARNFLKTIRAQCGAGSRLLIGVDLKKDPAVLHAAYNDAAGVTAAFNLNLLHRINRELAGTFDVDAGFGHHACYNPTVGRMEMHLVSLWPQVVEAAGRQFGFEEGETIHTENCYKYALPQFRALAAEAGYRVDSVWTDDRHWFSVQLLTAL